MKTKMVLLCAAGALVLGACGGGNDSSTPTTIGPSANPTTAAPGSATTAGGGSGKQACSIVTKADVNAAFAAEPTEQDEQPVKAGGLGVCTYSLPGEPIGPIITVRWGPGRSASFEGEVAGTKAAGPDGATQEAVPGLGDKAAYTAGSLSRHGLTLHTSYISVVKGSNLLQIGVSGTAKDSAARTKLTSLASAALPRI